MNRAGDPFPRYMVEDSRHGHQIPGRAEYVREFKEQDRIAAAELIVETAEIYSVHLEIGTKGWNGLPLFAAAMSFELRDELLEHRAQYLGKVAILRLTWEDMCKLPGFTEDQLSRREAGLQARANYFASLTPSEPPLPQ
ncbi:MAG TPA: hypothetical protein VNG32_01765 [Candidatus Dormibacteraeota bacterium]|nr:hypothetical protein [Candidatus Dormibacteraeota bacterium]